MSAVTDPPDFREICFILDEALALGIRVGTDGTELFMVGPLRVPYETRRWFEIKLNEFRTEVIDIIEQENAARPGAAS